MAANGFSEGRRHFTFVKICGQVQCEYRPSSYIDTNTNPAIICRRNKKWDSTQPVITESNRLIAAICAAEVRKTDTAADQPNTEQKWNKQREEQQKKNLLQSFHRFKRRRCSKQGMICCVRFPLMWKQLYIQHSKMGKPYFGIVKRKK